MIRIHFINSQFLNVIKVYVSQYKTLSVLCPIYFSGWTTSGLFQERNHKNRLLYNRIPFPYITQISTKKTKKNKFEDDEESDSDDEKFLMREREKIKGVKVSQLQVDSLRVDSIIKKSLDIPRNRVDVLFYEGRIRVNGRKIEKKSHEVNVGDEVDVIREIHPENFNCLNVGRVEVLKGKPTGDFIILIVRRQKQLMVENYEEDPWVDAKTKETNTTNEASS